MISHLPGYDLFLHGVTERGNWLARRTRHLVTNPGWSEEAVLPQGHGEDLVGLGDVVLEHVEGVLQVDVPVDVVLVLVILGRGGGGVVARLAQAEGP